MNKLEKELSNKIGLSHEFAVTLKSYSKNGLQPLALPEFEGPTPSFSGISIKLSEQEANKLITQQRKQFSNKGFLLFRSEMNFNFNSAPDEVSVIKSTDQFDILRYSGTNGYNYDISPTDVINKLKEWEKRFPFHIVGADSDWVQAEFNNTETDLKDLANEIYEFCPDMVEQGTGTIEALEAEMERNKGFYLWWD
ncbi:DUF4253 domain-containing protein [Paenibacillus tuaregi]|uniref:DUF4253 domain-containing protein n=1 Tax=Paenibacillus tuaregi TaxID=1816681 RepID=UPI0008391D3A|nr:DUF4253 domain-containing protein [Paenibacillus tuaregi]